MSRAGTIVGSRRTTTKCERSTGEKSKALTVRMLLPIVDPIDSASRNKKRNTMCTFTWRSTAVRLMGAAVAFRISFVSWPVNTTSPYAHGVFRICAPRSNSWSGPRGTCFGTPPAVTSSTVPSYVYNELFGCSERNVPCSDLTRCGDVKLAVCGDACLIFKFVSL